MVSGEYWIVVYTRGGRESALARWLRKHGHETYMPIGRRRLCKHRRSGRGLHRSQRQRIEDVDYLVLPNYVFVLVDPEVPPFGTLDPVRCPVANHVIMAPASRGADPEPHRIADDIIAEFRRREADQKFDEQVIRSELFRVGVVVQVHEGPLQGCIGRIIQEIGEPVKRVKVDGGGWRLDLDVDILTPIGLNLASVAQDQVLPTG